MATHALQLGGKGGTAFRFESADRLTYSGAKIAVVTSLEMSEYEQHVCLPETTPLHVPVLSTQKLHDVFAILQVTKLCDLGQTAGEGQDTISLMVWQICR